MKITLTKEQKTAAIRGALYGLAFYLILPVLAGLFSSNPFKFDETGDWVAIYPSVAKNIAMNSFFVKLVAFLLAVAGGIAVEFARKDLAFAKMDSRGLGIGSVLVAIAVFVLQYSAGDYKGDFTHKTIRVEQFDEKKAKKGKYDREFKKFFQEDKAYNDSARFHN